MKKILSILRLEFHSIYKQNLIYSLIGGVILSLAIVLSSVSFDIISGYKDFIDEHNEDGFYLGYIQHPSNTLLKMTI